MTRARLLEYQGKKQSVTAWATELKMPRQTILSRIDRDGWTVEQALGTPIDGFNASKESTQLARQLRAELLADVYTFHQEHGRDALLAQMKTMLGEGKAIQLYTQLILPLMPKRDEIEQPKQQVAVNIINHLPADALDKLEPITLEANG